MSQMSTRAQGLFERRQGRSESFFRLGCVHHEELLHSLHRYLWMQAVDLTTPVAVRPAQQYGAAATTSEADELTRLRDQVAHLQRSVMQKEDSLSAMSAQVLRYYTKVAPSRRNFRISCVTTRTLERQLAFHGTANGISNA